MRLPVRGFEDDFGSVLLRWIMSFSMLPREFWEDSMSEELVERMNLESALYS